MQLVSVVGFSPDYVLLICVAGALFGTELSSGEHAILYCVAGALSGERVMLYCVAGLLSGTELSSGKCTVLYIILTSHINNLNFILYNLILSSYRKF